MNKLGVKERIIETASRLFYFEGYNQTGINQIIEEANVAKASMYQHFRSKEDIAVAYLQGRHTMWMSELSTYVADKNSPKEKLIGSFDFLDKWLTEVEFRGCGFQNIITDLPKEQQKIKDQVRLHKNDVREWIHGLVKEEGALNDSEAEQLGDEVLILVEGAIILTQIQHDIWPVKTAKKMCIDLLNK